MRQLHNEEKYGSSHVELHNMNSIKLSRDGATGPVTRQGSNLQKWYKRTYSAMTPKKPSQPHFHLTIPVQDQAKPVLS